MSFALDVESTTATAVLTAGPGNVGKAAVAGMNAVGVGLLTRMKANLHQMVHDQTGAMGRAAFYRVEASQDGTVSAVVGGDLSKAPYFRAQDRGAVITPKKSANLAIPIGQATTSKGVARFSARDLISSPQSFGYVGTFTRNGVIFGVAERAKGGSRGATKFSSGSVQPLFVLRSSVTLKPVGFMAKTLNENKQWIAETLGKYVGSAVNASY